MGALSVCVVICIYIRDQHLAYKLDTLPARCPKESNQAFICTSKELGQARLFCLEKSPSCSGTVEAWYGSEHMVCWVASTYRCLRGWYGMYIWIGSVERLSCRWYGG